MAMSKSVKDVVCGMEVDPHQNRVTYLEIDYAFCSAQCRERFMANPHLYIGLPGQKAPKQEGREVLKRRRLRLAQPLSPPQAAGVIEALRAMMGIKAVSAEGVRIEIVYDLLQATAEQIEEKLAEIGVQLGGTWTEQLRRAFVYYEEECELSNLEVRERHHHH